MTHAYYLRLLRSRKRVQPQHIQLPRIPVATTIACATTLLLLALRMMRAPASTQDMALYGLKLMPCCQLCARAVWTLASMTERMGARSPATAVTCQIRLLARLLDHAEAFEPTCCSTPCPHLPCVHVSLQSEEARLQGDGSRQTRESRRLFGMCGGRQRVVPCTRPS